MMDAYGRETDFRDHPWQGHPHYDAVVDVIDRLRVLHWPDPNNVFVCRGCGKAYPCEDEQIIHEFAMVLARLRHWDECGGLAGSAVRHLRALHYPDPKDIFVCHGCGKRYPCDEIRAVEQLVDMIPDKDL